MTRSFVRQIVLGDLAIPKLAKSSPSNLMASFTMKGTNVSRSAISQGPSMIKVSRECLEGVMPSSDSLDVDPSC